ncbi:MAG: MASE1 domain-containing protein, partial [Actinomycetota bacterium]|nr:MASE1 domain-containing protein [Actinomycetota bacterium]
MEVRAREMRSVVAAVGATAVAYYAAQVLAVTVVPVTPSPVWFPAGVGLVIVLLFGRHLWPGIALSAFAFAILPTPFGIGWPPDLSMWSGFVNAGQVSLAAWLLGRAGFDTSMSRVRDVAAFIGAALLLAPAVGGMLGAVGLAAGGVVPFEALLGVWLTWTFGDALGVACLAPALLTLWSRRDALVGLRPRNWSKTALAELALLSISVLGTAWFVFGPAAIPIIGTPPYLVIPALLWAATRFGQPGAASAIFTVTVAGVLGTATGHGPFATGAETENFIRLQLFLGLAAAATLTLGAMVSEREASYRRERESAERFRALLEQSKDGISIGRPDGTLVLYSPAMERLSGYSMEEVNEHGWFALVYPDPDERLRAVQIAADAMSGGAPYVEMPIVRKDGVRRWFSFSTTPVVVGG